MMENAQIKAEREVIVHKLLTGTATQQERDTALATMMLSLWTYADLREYFLKLHHEQCDICPARKTAEPAGQTAAQQAQTMPKTLQETILGLMRTWGWVVLGLVWIIAKLTGANVPVLTQ